MLRQAIFGAWVLLRFGVCFFFFFSVNRFRLEIWRQAGRKKKKKTKRGGEEGMKVNHGLEGGRIFSFFSVLTKVSRRDGAKHDGKMKPACIRIRTELANFSRLWGALGEKNSKSNFSQRLQPLKLGIISFIVVVCFS